MSVRRRRWKTRLGEYREAWVADYVDERGERHIQTFESEQDAHRYHDDAVRLHSLRWGEAVAAHLAAKELGLRQGKRQVVRGRGRKSWFRSSATWRE